MAYNVTFCSAIKMNPYKVNFLVSCLLTKDRMLSWEKVACAFSFTELHGLENLILNHFESRTLNYSPKACSYDSCLAGGWLDVFFFPPHRVLNNPRLSSILRSAHLVAVGAVFESMLWPWLMLLSEGSWRISSSELVLIRLSFLLVSTRDASADLCVFSHY